LRRGLRRRCGLDRLRGGLRRRACDIHRHVPLHSAFAPAMLSMESPIVACEKQHARRPSDLCRAGFQPRHKPTGLCPSTACAASPAQSPPYDADPKRELAPKLPNSNRSRYRLEFNISPTKQRTGVLSNRSYKWRFLGQISPPASSVEGLPAILSAVSSAVGSAEAEALAEEEASAKSGRRDASPPRSWRAPKPSAAYGADQGEKLKKSAGGTPALRPESRVTRHVQGYVENVGLIGFAADEEADVV
jgi:hypothetical protein